MKQRGDDTVAHYLVRARLKPERAEELQEKLKAGAFETIRPFGRGLSDSLRRARKDPKSGEAVWEEQCFCSPPLAMERPAVLDDYFDDITTEEVSSGEGWKRISDLPELWK